MKWLLLYTTDMNKSNYQILFNEVHWVSPPSRNPPDAGGGVALLSSAGRAHPPAWWWWRVGDTLPALCGDWSVVRAGEVRRPQSSLVPPLSLSLLLLHLLHELRAAASQQVWTVGSYLGSLFTIEIKTERRDGGTEAVFFISQHS